MSNILVEPHPFPSSNNCHWPSVSIALREGCLACLQRPGLWEFEQCFSRIVVDESQAVNGGEVQSVGWWMRLELWVCLG